MSDLWFRRIQLYGGIIAIISMLLLLDNMGS